MVKRSSIQADFFSCPGLIVLFLSISLAVICVKTFTHRNAHNRVQEDNIISNGMSNSMPNHALYNYVQFFSQFH